MKVGIIGWRGMVGSVLMQRMREENDLAGLEVDFFSTSRAGTQAPAEATGAATLLDAHDLKELARQDVLISCQGGDYTSKVHPALRGLGYKGIWIDAASSLRMSKDSVIILDPVNRQNIEGALDRGVKDFIGGNCTVSLMLMVLGGLFRRGWVEWLSSMTYQAASGAGAANMRELVQQMASIAEASREILADGQGSALELEACVSKTMRGANFPRQEFGAPLAGSLLPWIDKAVDGGQTREEWKGMAETNKILGTSGKPVAVDGICVRVSSLRCHSQAFTIKLVKDIPLDEIEGVIRSSNEWVRLVANTREASLAELTPAAVSGRLQVAIGRLHKLKMGGDYLGAFSVGDQLLWGAAEPLRRMLRIFVERG